MRTRYILLIVLLLTLGFGAGRLSAATGTLDSPGPPAFTFSYTLENVYNRLNDGAAGAQSAFAEPASGPTTGTGHTLDEIMALSPAVDDTNGAAQTHVLTGKTFWGLTSGQWGPITGTAVAAPVPKTGQTGCWDDGGTLTSCAGTGQDGEYQNGVAWPNPRFIMSLEGIVMDTLTGLIWLQDANCIQTQYSGFDTDGTAGDGRVTWQHALDFVVGINTGTYSNCGGSVTDWRLPNVRDLQSLIDYGRYSPALPGGHPFTDVQSSYYWSSTTLAGGTLYAWYVSMDGGYTIGNEKPFTGYVWPVRGGQ